MSRYPAEPGFVRGSDTSEAAARSVIGTRVSQLAAARRYLLDAEPFGLTSDELERLTGWPHQTASALLRKLVLDGDAWDSAERRLTRYGRKAVVRRIVVQQGRLFG